MLGAYHQSLAESKRSRESLKGKFCDKLSADRCILSKLQLEVFRVSFKMSKDPIVSFHKNGRYIYKGFAQGNSIAPLMRGPHEEHAIG
jgi:hypothetical protein